MVFNSIEYIAFLAAVVLAYWALPRRAQNLFLLGASYFFYGCWDFRLLPLLCVSTGVNYVSAQLVRHREPPTLRLWLPAALVTASTFACVTIDWHALRSGTGPVIALGGFRGTAPWLAFGAMAAQAIAGRACRGLAEARRRRVFLAWSVVANLGLLACFKYFDFFAHSAMHALETLGMHVSIPELRVLLPVGLSFYTFQTLGYVVDVYRRQIEPTEDFVDFALFVAYFPQVVAGPIARGGQLLPQLAGERKFAEANLWGGLQLQLLGMLKKVAIADGLAPKVDAIFRAPAHATGAQVLIATLLYSIQIACDFSGYTDIARGSSKLFGIELVPNFDRPYLAQSPQEFWRRWHVSLSTWLRDYLYLPLGGSRRGTTTTYRNLMITMLLGGLWHGPAWSFVLWGGFHGIGLCVHRATGTRSEAAAQPSRLRALFAMAGCYLFVCYGWLLFRAGSLNDIVVLSRALATSWHSLGSLGPLRPPLASCLAGAALGGLMLMEKPISAFWVWRFAPVRGAVYAVMVLSLLMAAGQDAFPDFIYFHF